MFAAFDLCEASQLQGFSFSLRISMGEEVVDLVCGVTCGGASWLRLRLRLIAGAAFAV